MKRLSHSHIFKWIAAFAAIAAAGASLYIGSGQSVWFDEAYSIALAERSWGDIVRLTAQDVHPPMYYWLLKAWMMVFGSGEVALRSMSALFLMLSILVMALLLRKLLGTRTTLLALPFIVFAPFLLRYGFEIRMYALASFIGVTATYILVVALNTEVKKKRLMLFGVYSLLVVIGMYTLYFMALIWIAHLVWICMTARAQRQWSIFWQAAAAYTASLLVFLPWLPNLLRASSGGSLSPVTHSLGFDNLVGIITYLFLYRPPWYFTALYVCAVVSILVAIGYAVVHGYRQATAKERRAISLLGTYFLVPIAVLLVVTQIFPVYLERYLAHFALGGYACLGVLTAMSLRQKNWLAYGAAGILTIALLVGCMSLVQTGNYNFQRLHKPSVKQVAARLGDCKNGAVIFADGPQVAVELKYYVKDCPVYFFNETLEMGGGFAMISYSPERVASASELPKTDKIFHIYYDEPKNTLPTSFHKADEVMVGAVHIATYQRSKN
jgi:hypothetical protein